MIIFKGDLLVHLRVRLSLGTTTYGNLGWAKQSCAMGLKEVGHAKLSGIGKAHLQTSILHEILWSSENIPSIDGSFVLGLLVTTTDWKLNPCFQADY